MRHQGDSDGFPESRLLILSVFSIIFSLKYIMTEHFVGLFLLFAIHHTIKGHWMKRNNILGNMLIHFLDES